MKKLASMIGVSVLSMTVAMAPAFAQQSKPQDPASPQASVQPKADQKAPVVNPPTKDEKNLTAKPGTDTPKPGDTRTGIAPAPKPVPDVKAAAPAPSKPAADVKLDKTIPPKAGTDVTSQGTTAKPAPDVKAVAQAPSKPAADVKQEKTIPPKAGTDVTSQSTTAKPAPDVKAAAPSSKSDTGVKEEKGSTAKPEASLKSDKPVTAGSGSVEKKKRHHHVAKKSGKPAISKAKVKSGVVKDTDKKAEKNTTVGTTAK